MRVVAGTLGGRRIEAPAGMDTRPTTDRVREAVFNSLASFGVVEGALVADLYAGSGAMGIEALSRGAEHCTFVERDRKALDVLRRNLESLGLTQRSTVIAGAAMSALSRLHCDIVIADPPYDVDEWVSLMKGLDAPMLVAEAAREVVPEPGWRTSRSKRYGRTWITVLEREEGPA